MKKLKIDQYFLTEKCPFSEKRKINLKAVKVFGVGLLVIGVLFVLFVGNGPDKKDKVEAQVTAANVDSVKSESKPQESHAEQTSSFGGFYVPHTHYTGSSNRQYGSAQVVRPDSANSVGTGERMPIGSLIPVLLVNKVISSDSNSPVIATIPEDITWKDSVVIPQGSKAIGQASFDDASRRLQVRYNTVVFPEGEQHAISAMGLLADGSSGLEGNYHSGELRKQTGKFLGNFVGGMAEGMKDKRSGGLAGIPYEPGSIKNGLLNGISDSAFDEAKSYSDEMGKVKPYLEVPPGVRFLLYLEKEF